MSIEIGKPYLWKSRVYGTVAVHVAKFSPNGKVAILSIDGGGDSTPANRFPELSDGIGYACLSALSPRTRPRKATTAAAKTTRRSTKPPATAVIEEI